jgi:glycosyltransferase involved in cell wall biosynthesis
VTDEVGRIVPTDNPEALADALLNVLAERDRFDPQGLREYALSRYSWSRIAGTYLELYANVLARGTVAA